MLTAVLLFVPIGFAVAVPTVWAALRLGRRLGADDTEPLPGQVKMARRTIPNTGGIGVYLAVAFPLAVSLLLAPTLAGETSMWASAVRALAGSGEAGLMAGFLACLTVLHALGLIDDRRPLGPLVKLAIMACVALAMPLVFDVRLLTLLDPHAGGRWLSIIATAIWFIVVINAMNFIDNMDGLSGGVAMLCAACFLPAAALNGQWDVAALLALLAGTCAGFLVFNFPPARVFMGDGGSLVLGFTLAFLTVRTTYVGAGEHESAWYAVLMPVVVLAVPLYDLISVSLVRLSQGKSPMIGDLQHLSHRLVKRGLSRRSAVLVIYALTLVTGISGIVLGSLDAWQAGLVGLQVVALLGAVALFEGLSSSERTREAEV